jgi:rhodanese-related sulfurtransferase
VDRVATLTTVEDLLAEAEAEIDRLTPAEAHEAAQQGHLLIDIRPLEQRRRDGLVPGAAIVDRNVLEWRLDPDGAHRNPELARRDRRTILICDEGYQSILAAATLRRFGLDSCDVIDGVQGWMAAGLPLEPTAAQSSEPR